MPAEQQQTIDICHATGSKTNPYNPLELPTDAIINSQTGKAQGHGKHEEDVIPAFAVNNTAWQFPGMNMPEGQELLDNNCFTLAIDKTGTPEVLPGGTIAYKVAVKNVGLDPVAYSRIKVKDYTVQLTPPTNPPPLLKPGDSLVWTGSRSAPEGLEACGMSLSNTAKVKLIKLNQEEARSGLRRSNQQGPYDSDTWVTKVICPLNVSIAKTSAQESVLPGGTVSYTVRVTNPGPLDLPTSSLKVEDPGAATLTPPAIIPAMLEPGQSLDWAATKVAGGVEACGTNVANTASVTVTPPLAEVIASTERRKSENGKASWPYTSWPESAVTSAAAPVLITGGACPVVTAASIPTAFRPAGPALSVTKTGPARVLAGGRVAYRVTLTNTGSANATDVTLRDQAPGVLALVSKPAGSTVSGRNIDWKLGTLVPGQSVTANVRFAARRTATGRACNVALASASGVDQVRARACTTFVAARRPATPVTG